MFFNFELNSYIVIELKIRKLKPCDYGQIKLYMNYIDENIKKSYLNNTIGIILCKEGDNVIIKYITDDRIHLSTYKLINV